MFEMMVLRQCPEVSAASGSSMCLYIGLSCRAPGLYSVEASSAALGTRPSSRSVFVASLASKNLRGKVVENWYQESGGKV